MAKLTLQHLSKSFAGMSVVKDVSLGIREGGFLALLGPSGCGKTTILRMIAGFEQPSDGSILLGDRVISDASGALPPERRNMAMVFQSYALWPHMSVAQNVGYPLTVRGIRGEDWRRKVADALAVVRLEPYADRRPAALSGGQRQRVALARCLVTSPDVVLLDEPLANLDRHLREQMEETFREFHQRSRATMVYVTHDQREAMALATDVAVMAEGRLLQVAAPEDIYARPEGSVVGGLIGQGAILLLPLPENAPRLVDWSMLRPALETPVAGAPRDILVRPEQVHLDPEGIAMQVQGSVFTGERYALDLAGPAGLALKAFSTVRLAPGDRASFRIEHGWCL